MTDVRSIVAAWIGLTVVASIVPAEDHVRLLPREVTLTGIEGAHGVLVERFRGDEAIGPADSGIVLNSDNPAVVRIEGTELIPVSEGVAVVRIEGSTDEAASQKVTVTAMNQPFGWSFRNHVEPVLARMGLSLIHI